MTSVQLVSNQIGDVGNDCALHQFGEFNKYSVLGVRQVVLGLRVSPLGGQRMLASQCPVDMQVSNPAYQASWRPIFVRWFGRDHLFTLISRSPVISKKTVHCLLHTAHYAQTVLLVVRQLLRDFSCVNPWGALKAFKGKGVSAKFESYQFIQTVGVSV